MCDAALLAANPLVRSHLDHCNSLFRGLSALDLHTLQCVQKSIATVVANTTKYSHITPVRKTLLQTHQTSKTYQTSHCFQGSPTGVQVIIPNILNLSLNPNIVCTKLMVLNDLPDNVRSAKSLSSFRKQLKTYLFAKAYPT